MSGTVERKRMWIADVVLRRAAKLLPVELPGPELPMSLNSIDPDAARVANLANLALLESAGHGRDLRGGFWRDLMRACDMLEFRDAMPRLQAEYHAALQRVGAPGSAAADVSQNADVRFVADQICRIPLVLRSAGDHSMVDLLAATGYTPGSTGVTREALVAVLLSESNLIEPWLTHSLNKRTPSGWFFSSDGTSSVVGFFPIGPRFTFSDPVEACAEFILREIDDLALSMSHRKGVG